MEKSSDIYRREDGEFLIELKLNTIQQLFNSFDPSPFRDKDLDSNAEEYIVTSAHELSHAAAIRLVLYLPQAACSDTLRAEVPYAIHNYFNYRARISARTLKLTLRRGRSALLIGLAFLFLCITAQHLLDAMGKEGLFWSILQEGFLISGWVAMWHPLDILLYQWWPIRQRRRILERLGEIPVELRPIPVSAA